MNMDKKAIGEKIQSLKKAVDGIPTFHAKITDSNGNAIGDSILSPLQSGKKVSVAGIAIAELETIEDAKSFSTLLSIARKIEKA
jgi:hypothetical protein